MATRKSEPDLATRIGTAIVEALDDAPEARVITSRPRTVPEVAINTIRDIEIPSPDERRIRVWIEEGCLHVLTKKKHVTVCVSVDVDDA